MCRKFQNSTFKFNIMKINPFALSNPQAPGREEFDFPYIAKSLIFGSKTFLESFITLASK